MPGRLASENAVRNPARTAVTAAALMIGLGLVAFVTIFAAGLKDSFNAAIDSTITADTSSRTRVRRHAHAAGRAQAWRSVPGVSAVSPLATDRTRITGHGKHTSYGVDPARSPSGYRFDWVQGDRRRCSAARHERRAAREATADDAPPEASATRFTMITPRGSAHASCVVRGIYKDQGVPGRLLVPIATWRTAARHRTTRQRSCSSPGPSPDALKASVEAALQRLPRRQGADQRRTSRPRTEHSVNQLVTLLYVLLAISVIISIFGIVNTLVLSIFERTREIGMLRAIGTTRWQVRWMIPTRA